MKYNNFPAFESHLKQAAPDHFADIYLIISKEEFERDRAQELLRTQLLKGESAPEICCKIFDGEGLSLEALLGELQTMPFLTKRKLVLVRRADKLPKSSLKELEAYFAQVNRRVKLVLTASELTSNTTFYKKAEAAGVLLDVPQKKGAAKEAELLELVERQLDMEGKRIDRRIALLLVKQLSDATQLRQELEKLVCYVGERSEVTAPDISAICSVIPSDTIWQLGEAIFRLDIPTAWRIGHALLDNGTPLLVLLAQIRYQLQTGYQVCSLLASGADPQEVTRHFAYMTGHILEKQCRMAREYGLTRFKKGLTSLSKTETEAKDSGADAGLLFEQLLFVIAS